MRLSAEHSSGTIIGLRCLELGPVPRLDVVEHAVDLRPAHGRGERPDAAPS